MAQYLLDTNILLRASDAGSDKQSLAQGAFEAVISQGHTCLLTAQVIGEYYSVVTRPISSNGFGWDTERGKLERDLWIARFSFLEETAEIFPRWIDLIDKFKVTGRRIFDLRILAVMQVYKTSHLLTFDVDDFPALPGITIVHPSQIVTT